MRVEVFPGWKFLHDLQEDLDVLDATFACPDLTRFCRLDGLGLEVTGQRLEPDRAVLACRVVSSDPSDRWCRRCGCEGTARDTVVRELAHEPFGWRPTIAGGDRAPVPVQRLPAGVAAGHHRGGRAEGEADAGERCGGRWRRWWSST